MKLLFDQNLSSALVTRLKDIFPDSSHIRLKSLEKLSDKAIWDYAKEHGFTIVSKDLDFNDILLTQGFPPKVLLIQLGNCSTDMVEKAIRNDSNEINAFEQNKEQGILTII
jgi:predicted nuclease of predicted toxin-antitoxin system